MNMLDDLISRVKDVTIYGGGGGDSVRGDMISRGGGYLEIKTKDEQRVILAALRIAQDLKEIVDGH